MSDVLTINGSSINLATFNASLDMLVPYVKGGIPELHFSKYVGALASLPDTWSAQPCTLTMGGTLVFTGDVQGYIDRYLDGIGWVREYRALGLRNRADYIPNTDSVTLTDTSVFNLPGDDPNFIGSRAGLTVGQIITQVLTSTQNATALSNSGIGAYTSFSPTPTLPSLTVNDLAALSIIPPWRVTISGERILQSLEAFAQSCHPNVWLHVQPDGTIRFFDLRLASAATLTLGSDARLGMPTLTRDYSDCYSQVEVRGNTKVVGWYFQTNPWTGSSAADGGLAEDFAWGSFTNTQAKNNWVPSNYNQPSIGGDAQDYGSCTCPDTTHVTVTSHDNTATWAADFWAQGGNQAQGQLWVFADLIPGISQVYQARIVANTALAAAGTSVLTLDRPLPATTYNSYQIFGLAENGSVVWRKYKVTNAQAAGSLLNYFPYPFAVRGAVNSASASLTSTPVGFVQWSSSGSPPYNVSSMDITVDPVNGLVYFVRPTALIFGSQVTPPNNVVCFVPVGTGSLNTFAPSSSTYAGTSFTVEGLRRTKVITCLDWKDYSNNTNMATFASEYLDSVKNVVVEGTIPYKGLLTTYLTPGTSGQAINIAGNGYTTGWESLALPVVSVDVTFNSGAAGTSYEMSLHVSNRRGRYTADNFLRPNVTGQQIGGDTTIAVEAPTPVEGFTGPASAWETGGSSQAAFDNYQVGGSSQGAKDAFGPWGDMGYALSPNTFFGPGQAPS